MEKLSKDWFTEGLIDFEYKKYMLLAYLKNVHREFDKTCLYPSLGDVVFHYRNLKNYIENKEVISSGFPKEISKEDVQKLKLIYKKVLKDDEIVEELNQISEYALDQFENTLKTGGEIYDFAESQLNVEPIGVRPMYQDEGYIFTLMPPVKDLRVYTYKVSFFEAENDSYRGLTMNYLETVPYSFTTTLENIKVSLVKRFRNLPNPATYAISSNMKFPYESTFLPIAKRLLMKSIAA